MPPNNCQRYVKIKKNSFFFLVDRAGTKYTVNVFGMFDGGESMPLAGEEKTTLSDDPELPIYVPSGKVMQYSLLKPA